MSILGTEIHIEHIDGYTVLVHNPKLDVMCEKIKEAIEKKKSWLECTSVLLKYLIPKRLNSKSNVQSTLKETSRQNQQNKFFAMPMLMPMPMLMLMPRCQCQDFQVAIKRLSLSKPSLKFSYQLGYCFYYSS